MTMFQNKNAFERTMDEILNTLLTSSKLTQLPEVRNRIKSIFDYTLEGGKRGRGYCVGFAYRTLEKPENITEEALQTTHVIGCCLEMTYFLAVDDIIDASTTRRGKPCWYLRPDVGSAAINDTVFMHQSVMEILRLKLWGTPIYTDVIRIFNEAVQYITIGQYLEFSSSYSTENKNIDLFTMDRYNTIVVYKTCDYSFNIPINLALLLVKNGNEIQLEKYNEIFFEIGKLLQVQNDFKDVYIDETVTGKAGTDIQEGKLTWVAIKALECCNEAQRTIFKEHYGRKDPKDVKRIKQLYDELQIPKVYEQYDTTIYDKIMRLIQALPTEADKTLCTEFLDACYGIKNQTY